MFSYPYERTRAALENLRKANDLDACHAIKLKSKGSVVAATVTVLLIRSAPQRPAIFAL